MSVENEHSRQTVGAESVEAVFDRFAVQLQQGLTATHVERRLKKYGNNQLRQKARRSSWQILIAQFKSPIIALLAVAAVLSFIFQEWIEGIAVLIAILLNTLIGFFTEIKAVRSMEALQQLSKTVAKVRRDGQVQEISAERLVPGDVVLLESGDLVAADLRLIEVSKLQADESALTGESVPVSKTTDAIAQEVPLAEQKNVVYKGTAITRGSGAGIVYATGMETELGRISSLTDEATDEMTPLEKRLDQLGKRLIWVTLAIAVVVAIAGILSGKDLVLMVETAIALSVAAVPEGLPIVATIALARGMWRMAKRNALINRLSAVETLGATSIICTDKTGTLTENQMTVTQLVLTSGSVDVTGEGLSQTGDFQRAGETLSPDQETLLATALKIGVLCNNAALPQSQAENPDKIIGDPMEAALLIAGTKANLRREDLIQQQPEVREVAFDAETKMMATVHKAEAGQYFFAVKGAPESVLPACTQQLISDGSQPLQDADRQDWEQQFQQLAERGLRILALAMKTAESETAKPYENLTFVGVVGLEDPPRQAAKAAIQACYDAGIRVIMVTGDQAVTARQIGQAVGLVDGSAQASPGQELQQLDTLSDSDQQRLQQVPIFARVSPEQKLNLIALHQKQGAIVAMTGDGVNDAPALKKADIGVAMGQRGTQVAREAADMVLQDDAFSSIIAAVEQGRAIFGNIRKFTLYLLSGNVGEILAVAIASLFNAPLPLLPLQILFLNAVNDVFPALALGVGEGDPSLMKHPPRDSQEAILTPAHWRAIAVYGAFIAAPVLAIFALSLTVLGIEPSQAVTISFLSLAFGRLWHVFNMRDDDSGLLRNEVTQNPYIWGALVICTGLLLSAVYMPGLSTALQTTHPGLQGWGLVLLTSLVPVILGQVWKTLRSR
ncbi:MAG: cation-translocating P-type ATPase [Leptolyngbya sp. SIO4C1]|nr:cation-translocating P-type ATPase [Leptolyngbya sp. SIO4C1]